MSLEFPRTPNEELAFQAEQWLARVAIVVAQAMEINGIAPGDYVGLANKAGIHMKRAKDLLMIEDHEGSFVSVYDMFKVFAALGINMELKDPGGNLSE